MKQLYVIITAIFALLCVSKSAYSTEPKAQCEALSQFQFKAHDIFNLDEKETIFLHRWANALHITTRESTLKNEAAYFYEQCDVSEQKLEELERHLRSKKYIRDAKVKKDNTGIQVETWDNWSLLPTIDFSRKAGQSQYAVGIKDRNLLGLGIDTEFEYYKQTLRTGYKIDTEFPLFMNKNISAIIRVTNNNDGTSKALFVHRPFVSFDSEWAFQAGFNNFEQTEVVYNLGNITDQFYHHNEYSTLRGQWLTLQSKNDVLRLLYQRGLGLTVFSVRIIILDHWSSSNYANEYILCKIADAEKVP